MFKSEVKVGQNIKLYTKKLSKEIKSFEHPESYVLIKMFFRRY